MATTTVPTDDERVIDLALVQIDRSYQRDANKALIQHISSNFDLVLADRIWLNERKPNEVFCFDGQQRVLGARAAGETELLARYFTGMTYIEEVTRCYELNTGRKPPTATEVFRYGYAGKQPVEVAIHKIVAKFGGRIYGIDGRDGQTVVAVEALRNVYRQGADSGLTDVCAFLVDAFGEISRQTTASAIVKGVYWMLSRHEEELNRERLIEKAAAVHTDGLRREAAGLAHGSPNPTSVYLALLTNYNRKLSPGKQLEPRLRGLG